MSPSFRGAACRAGRRPSWLLLLLPALLACDPSANGRTVGPLESWFRGPGPDEYLLALTARERGFATRDGRAGDTAWRAWIAEGRPLRIEERVTANETLRATYYGDASLAQLLLTRRDSATPGDSLSLTVDYAGDTVWRVRWRGPAALAPSADTTAWPADSLAALDVRARRRITWFDSLVRAERAGARSADSARAVDSARRADSAARTSIARPTDSPRPASPSVLSARP
jgi:hypothetical protein